MNGRLDGFTRRQFLAAASALPLVPALSQGASAPTGLRAGAAKVDITLPLGANNGGVILRGGPATRIHDELHARCLVLDDGQTRLALVICDLRMISRNLVDRAKQLAADALGWPPEQMLVAATHTHAAPGLVNIQHAEIDRWYADFVVVRIADAIRRAAANLSPATIGWASVSKPEHVFNRRWKIKAGEAPPNPFGETSDTVVMNPAATLPVLEPAGPVDPELSVISVRHADGRPLAVLANYGLHYVGGYEAGSVSADYFAVFAERVGELVGGSKNAAFVGMMSNGASGDVNNVRRGQNAERSPPWKKMQEVAEDLAQAAARLCQEMDYRPSLHLGLATRELELLVRQPDDERLRWSREMVQTIRDPNKLTRPQVYAEEALAIAAGPKSVSIPLQAFRIGPLGIAAAPCEVFAETGLAIKQQAPLLKQPLLKQPLLTQHSPLQSTFLIELANGYSGYLPTPEQHQLGGYETWLARSAFLEVNAATKVQDSLLDLLAKA